MSDLGLVPLAALAAPEGEEPLFSQAWHVVRDDFEHGGEVAAGIKLVLRDLGVAPELIRRLSIANFEAEMNVIMYADEADVTLEVYERAVYVTIADRGPGIPDVGLALQEGWSTATPQMRARGFGAGLGLPNIRRNADAFAIETTVGRGTTLRYRVDLGP